MEFNVNSHNTLVSSPSLAGGAKRDEINTFGMTENPEYEPTETLYSAVEQNDFIARKTEPTDVTAIEQLISPETRKIFKNVDIGKLYETSCFSLVIADVVEPDLIVAAACFSDVPMNDSIRISEKKWKRDSRTQNMTPVNTLFIHFFASSPEVPLEISLPKVIANTFNACSSLNFILLESPSMKYEGPFLFSPLTKTMMYTIPKERIKLFVYEKDLMFPRMVIREGREHDLDDLEPLLPLDDATLMSQFGKATLTDVIAFTDRNNQSIVAEFDAVAVGIITVTTDIDYDLLNKFFQLEPFHGLFKPHPKDSLNLTPVVSEMQFDLSPEDRGLNTEPVVDDFLQSELITTNKAGSLDKDANPIEIIVEPLDKIVLDGEKLTEIARAKCEKMRLDSHAKRYKVLPEPRLLRSPSKTADAIPEYVVETSDAPVEVNSREEANKKLEKLLEDDEDEVDNAQLLENLFVKEKPGSKDQPDEKSTPVTGDEEISSSGSGDDCVEGTAMTSRMDGKLSQTESSLDSHTHSKMTSDKKPGSSVVRSDSGSDIGSIDSLGSLSKSDDMSIHSKSGSGGSHKSGSGSEMGSLTDHDHLSCSDSEHPTPSSGSGSNITLSFHSSNDDDSEGPDLMQVQPSHESKADSVGSNEEQSVESGVNVEMSLLEVVEDVEEAKEWTKLKTQADILDAMQDVLDYVENRNLDLDNDREELSDDYEKLLEDAENFIHDSILQCLPRALADEEVLPLQMLTEVKDSVYYGIPNAIAIQLCALEPKYRMRMRDLIYGAFHNFPNREYLIVTIPTGSKEPAWLEEFVRVSPRNQSLYSKELFVLHRTTMTSTIVVRETKESDTGKVQELVQSLYDKYKVYTDYEDALLSIDRDKMKAYVAVVTNYTGKPIVGLAIVSVDKKMELYQVNYNVDRYTYMDFHDGKQLYIHHFILNPLFQRFSKLFLKEILRLTQKTCFFHTTYPDCINNEITEHQTTINNLEDMIPLMPRKKIDYADGLNLREKFDEERCPSEDITAEDIGFSVMHFAKKFCFDPKANLNERIVFVGASDTALSCLEALISSPYRSYKHLTVIDPYGIPGNLPPDTIRDLFFIKKGGKAMSFHSEAERARRLGLQNVVNVCYGWVTKILRHKQLVVVNKNLVVPYDILILATGLQFHRPDCAVPEIEDPHFLSIMKHTKHSVHPDTSRHFHRNEPKPKNVFTINTEVDAANALAFLRAGLPVMLDEGYVLVHGLCLESLACVKALLVLGITPQRIVFLTAPEESMKWQYNTGYVVTPTLESTMMKALTKLKIGVYEKYVYKSWWVDEPSLLVKRVFFTSTHKNNQISFPCLAFFSYCNKRVHDIIVGALTESYIFYKEGEGIIIDTKFRTVDPHVWAAGPATVYQMYLKAEKNKHAYFQSEDIGINLAEFVIRATQSVGGSVVSLDLVLPPEFKNPFIRAARLPGGWFYLYMCPCGVPSGCRPGECESCETGTEITTGTLDETPTNPIPKYFRLWFDGYFKVEAVECLSRKKFSASNLVGLYGQHETILNKLLEKLEKGEVTDLYDHFCQPWFGVFCHDRWSQFQKELRNIYSEHTTGDEQVKMLDFIRDYLSGAGDSESLQVDPNILRHIWDSSGLKTKVENRFLDYLKFNRTSLPMYARPDFVEKVIEERKASTVYQAQPIKY